MDIRVINSKNEIINLTNCDIKASGEYLIGINEYGITKQVEKFESKEKAIERLEAMSNLLDNAIKQDIKNLLIITK